MYQNRFWLLLCLVILCASVTSGLIIKISSSQVPTRFIYSLQVMLPMQSVLRCRKIQFLEWVIHPLSLLSCNTFYFHACKNATSTRAQIQSMKANKTVNDRKHHNACVDRGGHCSIPVVLKLLRKGLVGFHNEI